MDTVLSPEKERSIENFTKVISQLHTDFLQICNIPVYIILRNRSDNFIVLTNPNTFTTILQCAGGGCVSFLFLGLQEIDFGKYHFQPNYTICGCEARNSITTRIKTNL